MNENIFLSLEMLNTYLIQIPPDRFLLLAFYIQHFNYFGSFVAEKKSTILFSCFKTFEENKLFFER